MRLKMSKSARREVLLSLQPQYRHATWGQKQELLNGFVAATGYDRKYAIGLLNRDVAELPYKRDRRRLYGNDIREALLEIWRKAGNRLCSKRLVAILPVLVAKMEQFGHLQLSEEQKVKVLSISPATIDRLLKPERTKYGRGKSTTKPGYLIKRQIPLRTFADWNDVKPGFLEADCVAHCGESVQGQFLNTLTATDIATTWTETAALLRRSEADVMNALTEIRALLPFPLLGLDTDNGGEFINYTLLDWCKENAITFTRSREYKKNDQAHVEEKNGSVVRRLIGYDRYEGVESWQLLSALYRMTRLYVNFFQPSLKLDRKTRDGARVYRHYEKAQTPFERVLQSSDIPEENKERLRREFDLLDPVLLLSEIERLQIEFWRTAVTANEHDIPTSKDVSSRPADTPTTIDELPKGSVPDEPKPRRRRADRSAARRPASGAKKGRKSNLDEVWPEVCLELEGHPSLTRTQIQQRLNERYPGRFRKTQINTIGEKLQQWRILNFPNKVWPKAKPGRKTPIHDLWPEVCKELDMNPTLTARGIMSMLCKRYPDRCKMTQRGTVSAKLNDWRATHIASISIIPAESNLPQTPVMPATQVPAAAKLEGGSSILEPHTTDGDSIT